MILKNKKGFTLIEILVVVLIIGILASVLLVMWRNGIMKRAAVSSYKTTMKSVQAAIELCTGTGDTAIDGEQGVKICDTNSDGNADASDIGNEKYPVMNDSKCGNGGVGSFVITYDIPGNPTTWKVTTSSDCRGCRLECTSGKCNYIEIPAGSCNPT